MNNTNTVTVLLLVTLYKLKRMRKLCVHQYKMKKPGQNVLFRFNDSSAEDRLVRKEEGRGTCMRGKRQPEEGKKGQNYFICPCPHFDEN